MPNATLIVLKNAQVTINAVDLSTAVTQVTVDYKADMLDITAMGMSSRQKKAGLKDFTIAIDFNQDYTTGAVDGTMFSLIGATAFTCIVKPDTAASAVTNPGYSAMVVLSDYVPLGGGVGTLNKGRATFIPAGDLTRNVT